ncbi:MAG TPA: DUF2065 domain-containing protein [Steroidobacteraceae bacterium]|nr:DUF2065 domain-containing protein [Steroidobacteraceae bacterium]
MNWSDLLAAFALYLVLEGIMPFLNPAAMRRAMQTFSMLPDRQLRAAGFVSMLIGALLLYFVRGSGS